MRWLRPAYQNPGMVAHEGLGLDVPVVPVAALQIPVIPSRLAEQSRAVRQLLRSVARPLNPRLTRS